VIDDDATIRTALSSLIRSIGLSARTFVSADAWLASGETAFACLICDVHMPGTSGLQLQSIVSRWADRPPMIIMSGHGQSLRQAALEGGAVCYFEKPVDGDRLISCLQALLHPEPRTRAP
jgi:FixJ family two-component response regulator